ncbi:hypothetical protein [Oryza sativa Japonica Group]|uniref:Uncharacterized protein n=4 Tax=Oryza TaxID=4527 RepID=A2ZYG7_ORYSJ|nr:hypothetical protein OsJ_03690 [Oryza sativa Japonica Group]BAD53285.1 hypothetical protein [Oryza sativa Japonica Group]
MNHGHKRAVTANADIGFMDYVSSKCLSAAEVSSDGPCKTPLLKIMKTCAFTSALRSKPRVNKSASVKCAADMVENSSEFSNGSGLRCLLLEKQEVFMYFDNDACSKKLHGWPGALIDNCRGRNIKLDMGVLCN